MRWMGVMLVAASLWGGGEATAGEAPGGSRRFMRCCVELAIPEVPPGPICVQVRGQRALGPRRACRLLGGRPIGRGDCSLAACREPAA